MTAGRLVAEDPAAQTRAGAAAGTAAAALGGGQGLLQGAARVAALALAVLAWFAALAWLRPLMLPDEGRYVGVAWEMLRSRDWLVPTLDGLPYFHKPPLFYWITAASMSVIGGGDGAARAAPLLGATVATVATVLFVRRWWGAPVAKATLVVLATQPLVFLGAQFANLDMLVAGCITLAIVLAAHAVLAHEQGANHRLALAGAYAAAALGVLAKGLIGVVLPALVLGAWLVSGRRWRSLRQLLWWPGLALFAGLAAPWFVATHYRFEGFTDYFFVEQHVRRFAGGGFNNVQPLWFYPAVLAVFLLPWLPWLPWPGRRPAPSHDAAAVHAGLHRLLVLWAAGVVLFFSLPQSKLLGYVLPALPPLAVLVADGFVRRRGTGGAGGAGGEDGSASAPERRRGRGRGERGWWAAAALAMAVNVAAVAWLTARPQHSTKELAGTLRALRGPGEPVFMLDSYYFDLPRYAALAEPVGVVLDWSSPEVRRRDDWRKEMADAATFSKAHAERALVLPARFVASLCAAGAAWVVGPADAAAAGRFAWLAHAKQIAVSRGVALWRVERAPLAAAKVCAGTPSGG